MADARRRLEADGNYRRQCGYVEGVPSRSVFGNIATQMANNWDRFQACLLSPEEIEILSAWFSNSHLGSEGLSSLSDFLSALGWREGLPPLYQDDGKAWKSLRIVGKPRGRTSQSRGVATEEGVQITSGVGCGTSQSSVKRFTRDWIAYNRAQAHEPEEVKMLLGGFSDMINEMEAEIRGPRRAGRPALPLGHVVFAVVLKEYHRCPTRPIESYLREAVELGYLRNGNYRERLTKPRD